MSNEFKDRLQKALSESGMNAKELSERSGISEANISYYINGKYVAKQDKCFLLAKELNVDPGWLMTGDEPEPVSSEPHSHEAQIISNMVDKLTKSQREKLLVAFSNMFDVMFDNDNKERK